MSLTFPCEIISWNVLPAVRREMTEYLVNEKKISRKMVAGKLNLTEAAVCQYLKHKRGGNYKFNDSDLKKIKKMAELMMQSDKSFDGMCVVCREFDAAGDAIAQVRAKTAL
ncbi:MAG: hypothetical protein NUV67_00295 [archaeon]|nr:hypothetical protein [archaeon]